MYTKKIVFPMITGFLVLVTACEKKVGKEPAPVVNACDTITYDKHIKPLFDSKCSSCHKAGISGFPDLGSYAALKKVALNGEIKTRVIDAPVGSSALMPQGGPKLPQSQLSLFLCWINNGAKEK